MIEEGIVHASGKPLGLAACITSIELEQLYRKYGLLLHRRAWLILREEALAHDALQEAFVKVLRSTTALADIELPLRWLYRIVDRVALDFLRQRKSAPQVQATDAPLEWPSRHPDVPAEERDFALRFLAELDVESQHIALCAFVDGMSQAEIAADLGYSRVTINKRIAALRARAREHALRPPPSSSLAKPAPAASAPHAAPLKQERPS
jgi:RNA polymerase sigma-70 factor, ECF subfamily